MGQLGLNVESFHPVLADATQQLVIRAKSGIEIKVLVVRPHTAGTKKALCVIKTGSGPKPRQQKGWAAFLGLAVDVNLMHHKGLTWLEGL